MSKNQKTITKKVVHRKRHKSLGHLTEDDTKNAFDERLRGAHQRQESEPVYFGVSVMSDQGDSNLEVFQTLTRHNYQEAAKQRATRTLLPYPLHQGPRRGTSTRLRQSRSPEQSHQVDCLRESHLREYAEAGCQPEGLNRDTQTLPSMNPIPSQLVTPNFPACPTPCSMGSPHTLSFAFVTEAPIFRPISPSNGINTIDQSHQDFASPASNYQPETCGEGLLYPHYIHAGPSTFPPYNFPAEAYNGFNHQNAEFPLTNNCSFFSSEIP